MSNPTPTPATKSKVARFSPSLIGAGALVIALGFGLPQLAPKDAPEPTPARAANAVGAVEPLTPIAPPSVAGIGISLLKLVFGFAVVCVLCVLLTRWLRPAGPAGAAGMEVLASIAVGRCALHLVRAGERRLLIGTDPVGVKALVELPGSGAGVPPNSLPDPVASVASPTPPIPAAVEPLTRDEVLNLLLRLRARTGAPPSG